MSWSKYSAYHAGCSKSLCFLFLFSAQDYGSQNGLGLLSLGGISYGETGAGRYLTHPLIHSGFSFFKANTIFIFLVMVSFILLQGIAGCFLFYSPIWLGGSLTQRHCKGLEEPGIEEWWHHRSWKQTIKPTGFTGLAQGVIAHCISAFCLRWNL